MFLTWCPDDMFGIKTIRAITQQHACKDSTFGCQDDIILIPSQSPDP